MAELSATDFFLVRDQGYPEIRFKLDGKPASIGPYSTKRVFLEAGFVFLGGTWERELALVTIGLPERYGDEPFVGQGYVFSPELARLVREHDQGLHPLGSLEPALPVVVVAELKPEPGIDPVSDYERGIA